MNYRIDTDDLPIKERICKINGIDEKDLDVSKFIVDYELEILKDFKKKLLSDKDKRFFIVGDYNCDGICATTIIKKLFEDLGIESNYYIPSRSKQGYGLNNEIVKTAYDNGFKALICVDNGVVAYDQMKYAKSLGLKTYVIDHHEYEKQVEVDGFLHPDLFPERYHDMCAAGLCCLLSNSFREDDLTSVYGGLATLADMVSVLNYNRYLLKKMITILYSKQILPLMYLLAGNEISYDSLSYNVIPKINAVSRLEEMMNVNYVVRYLLDNSPECMKYLNKIEEINRTRKDLTLQMSSLAERLCDGSERIIIVRSEVFKEGLCGLIANRLLGFYGKPVVVLAEKDGELKGSGRAPADSDLFGYLSKTKELFDAYGGHAQAVGLSMKMENYDRLITYIKNNEFEFEGRDKDALYLKQEDLNAQVIKQIEDLQPYGTGFMQPLLCSDGNYLKRFTIKGKYPKFVLNEDLEAISFNSALIDKKFSKMIGHLRRDSYHKGRLSFVIEDLI